MRFVTAAGGTFCLLCLCHAGRGECPLGVRSRSVGVFVWTRLFWRCRLLGASTLCWRTSNLAGVEESDMSLLLLLLQPGRGDFVCREIRTSWKPEFIGISGAALMTTSDASSVASMDDDKWGQALAKPGATKLFVACTTVGVKVSYGVWTRQGQVGTAACLARCNNPD